MTQFHLRDITVRAVGVDSGRGEAWVRKHLPANAQHGFLFFGCDVRDFRDANDLFDSVRRVWPDFEECDVIHAHGSPNCRTMSPAPRGIKVHRDELSQPLTPEAEDDDEALVATIALMRGIEKESKHCLLTLENSRSGHFPALPCVKQLLMSGWILQQCMFVLQSGRHA